ncbi:MAG: hypothetical protein LBG66_01285 [Gallionellaceae bacterium]|jgi:preprotein translocase subunit SecD|nr:hypothetical protein [Gallionellaceae bacterium]
MRKLIFLSACCLMLANSVVFADCQNISLQVRLVDEDHQYKKGARLPRGSEAFHVRNEQEMLLVKKAVIFTGEHIADASPGADRRTNEPVVNLTLDSVGTHKLKDVTHDNVNKRMAIILFKQGEGEIIFAPFIRERIDNGRLQISGLTTIAEAQNIADAIKCQARQRH